MKIIGINGQEYSWNLTRFGKSDNPSSLHLRARILLQKIFPTEIVYEEVTLPGTYTERQNHPIYADFYIHSKRLMIEVQGEQHYKFNQFFFRNKMDFFKLQYRDKLKSQWCDINKIHLIYFPYNETDMEWEKRISNRYNEY